MNEDARRDAAQGTPKMDRRTFLLTLSGGAFSLTAGALLAGCGGGGGSSNISDNNSNGTAPVITVPATANADGSAALTLPNPQATPGTPPLVTYSAPAGTYQANTNVTLAAASLNNLPIPHSYNGYYLVSSYVYQIVGKLGSGAPMGTNAPLLTLSFDPTLIPTNATGAPVTVEFDGKSTYKVSSTQQTGSTTSGPFDPNFPYVGVFVPITITSSSSSSSSSST